MRARLQSFFASPLNLPCTLNRVAASNWVLDRQTLMAKRCFGALILFFVTTLLVQSPTNMAVAQNEAKKTPNEKPKTTKVDTNTDGRTQKKISVADRDFFEAKIRPVLINECYECHSEKSGEAEGGLLLDSSDALLRGGDSGAAIEPGKPKESLLLSALHYEDLEMPPSKKLSAKVVKDFEEWIARGAPDPRTTATSGSSTAKKTTNQSIDWQKARQFWSFTPPKTQPLPRVKNRSWPANRIDYFVLNKMESQGLSPAEPASSAMLQRRLHFDLIGLPNRPGFNKHPEEPSAAATNASNIDRQLNQLFAQPQFGEHWSRLWLDLARYAEDQAHIVGNNKALFYPNAYLYRDWVINAFNEDLPYDEFVKQQLAIDLINPPDELSDNDLSALGFLGLGPKYYRRGSLEVMADEWEDRIDTVSRGLLGLTVACARCHDHKYDPITTKDYYALAGIFASTEMYNKPLPKKDPKANNDKAPSGAMHIVRDAKKLQNLPVFVRGDVKSKGEIVERRFLQILSDKNATAFEKSSGRKELAEAIASTENPLFARVMVNRVWAKLIGKALVGTPSNFGALGETPSHPELLDDLAARFMEKGWSLKWLIREIVTSKTYQLSSLASPDSAKSDPQNKWLSHMNRKRLSVEQMRDAILQTCGNLDGEIGGESINPLEQNGTRRTIYSKVSRFQLNALLANFDFPDPNAHAANRSKTITPLQKMFVLNSPYMLHQAKQLRQLLQNESPVDSAGKASPEQFVKLAFQRILGRTPEPYEHEIALRFVNGFSDDPSISETTFIQTLLIGNEFLYID